MQSGEVGAAVVIELREKLGIGYSRELLRVPFSALDRDALVPGCVALEGVDGSIEAQATGTEFWQGQANIKKGYVVFVADLPALATRRYSIRSKRPKSCSADLKVDIRGNEADFRTKRFSLQLPIGAAKGKATGSSDVPAPFGDIQIGNGKWKAAVGWFGPDLVKAWSARVVEAGPMISRWEGRWEYATGATLHVRVSMAAGDSRAEVETEFSGDTPDSGWFIDLSQIPGLRVPLIAESANNPWGQRVKVGNDVRFEKAAVVLADQPSGPIVSLVPWPDWWDGRTQTSWTFVSPEGEQLLFLESLDGPSWIEPGAIGSMLAWGSPAQRKKWVPLGKDGDGHVRIRFNNAGGTRKFLLGSGAPGWGRALEKIGDMTLEWSPTVKVQHPLLFVDRSELLRLRSAGVLPTGQVQQLLRTASTSSVQYGRGGANALGPALRAYVISGDSEVARKGRLPEIADDLGMNAVSGNFDYMRSTTLLTNLYDAIADDGVLSEAQLRLLRARMAWLGYHLADPGTWSSERGFGSGNLDMHISFAVNLGLVAAALPDHPMSAAWWSMASQRVERWLSMFVGPNGEWPENTHYTSVSFSTLLPLVLAARHRGNAALLKDDRVRRALINLARQYAPPDPRYSNLRTLVGYGKGTAGERFALAGVYAKAIRPFDATTSREMQWVWLQGGKSLNFGNRTMMGFEDVVTDPGLESSPPDWDSLKTSDFVLSDSNFGGEAESFFFFLNSASPSVSPREAGSIIALYARGKPISVLFGNGEHSPWTREIRLQNRVIGARDWSGKDGGRSLITHDKVLVKGTGGSVLPHQDYAQFIAEVVGSGQGGDDVPATLSQWPQSKRPADGPFRWTRQILFVKPSRATDAHYCVFRDTVTGGQATEWTLWLLAKGIAPGPSGTAMQTAGVTELPLVDTYTAMGQYDVDLELFVASPRESPRHTLRWGFRQGPGFNQVPEGFGETQDLFHLRMDSDGSYYVVAYPRAHAEVSPRFSTEDEGRVIRIESATGTDWIFLGDGEQGARTFELSFSAGAVGSIQLRKERLVLALARAGTIAFRRTTFTSELPATVDIDTAGNSRVAFEDGHPGGAITVSISGKTATRYFIAPGVREQLLGPSS